MLLSYPLPGTPWTPVWYPIIPCLEPHLHVVYHHLHLVYHCLSGTPPSMSGAPPSLSGTPPVSGIWPHYWNPTPVWNPIMCLERHSISCLISDPSAQLPPSCPQYPTLSGHCCSYLVSNCPLPPLIWPLPAHHLQVGIGVHCLLKKWLLWNGVMKQQLKW